MDEPAAFSDELQLVRRGLAQAQADRPALQTTLSAVSTWRARRRRRVTVLAAGATTALVAGTVLVIHSHLRVETPTVSTVSTASSSPTPTRATPAIEDAPVAPKGARCFGSSTSLSRKDAVDVALAGKPGDPAPTVEGYLDVCRQAWRNEELSTTPPYVSPGVPAVGSGTGAVPALVPCVDPGDPVVLIYPSEDPATCANLGLSRAVDAEPGSTSATTGTDGPDWWTPTGTVVLSQEQPFACGQPVPEFTTLGPERAELTIGARDPSSSESFVTLTNVGEDQLVDLSTESVVVFLAPGTQNVIGLSGTDMIPTYRTIGHDESVRLRYLPDPRDCRFEPSRSLPDGVYRAYLCVFSKDPHGITYRVPIRAQVVDGAVRLLPPG